MTWRAELSCFPARRARVARTIGARRLALFTACHQWIPLTDASARASRNPHSYVAWLLVCDGGCILLFALLRRGKSIVIDARSYWQTGLLGGALSVLAYWIVIWAMTIAPIAIVAALRETSVLFGTLIAVVVLKESLTAVRVIAALDRCGLALIRFRTANTGHALSERSTHIGRGKTALGCHTYDRRATRNNVSQECAAVASDTRSTAAHPGTLYTSKPSKRYGSRLGFARRGVP